MNSTAITINALQILSSTSCQEIEDFIKDLNASEYESKNVTREEYIQTLRSPYCEPKPYLGVQGWKKWTVSIIIIVFLIFGLIGNSLSATIMFRRARRGLSSYFYLAFLAIIDICILYTGCLLFFLEIAFNYRPELKSEFFCQLAFYVQHSFTYISAWLIVAVTFERFMVVRFPFQSIRICRMRVAYTITLIIILFFSIYTAHCIFTIKLTRIELQTDDGFHPDYLICDLGEPQYLYSLLDLCFYSVFPSILILIFNILIILTMFHAMKQRREYLQVSSYTSTKNKNKSASTNRTQFFRSRSAESSPAGRSYSQITKQQMINQKSFEQNQKKKVVADSTSSTGIRLTCLLLTISFIFVLCTLPISIRSLIADYLPTHKTTTRWQLTQLCLTLLMYLNHTMNFVLYCLTGRAFRSDCRKLIYNLWIFKDIQITCKTTSDTDKYEADHHHQHHPHHQQFVLTDRNRYIFASPKRNNPINKGIYL